MMMVLIAYSDGFKDLHDYFRVVLEDSLANYTGYRCRLCGGAAAQLRDDPRPPPQELPGLVAQRANFFD